MGKFLGELDCRCRIIEQHQAQNSDNCIVFPDRQPVYQIAGAFMFVRAVDLGLPGLSNDMQSCVRNQSRDMLTDGFFLVDTRENGRYVLLI